MNNSTLVLHNIVHSNIFTNKVGIEQNSTLTKKKILFIRRRQMFTYSFCDYNFSDYIIPPPPKPSLLPSYTTDHRIINVGLIYIVPSNK